MSKKMAGTISEKLGENIEECQLSKAKMTAEETRLISNRHGVTAK